MDCQTGQEVTPLMISERDAGSYLAYSRDKTHPPKSGGVIARDPQTLSVSAPPGAYEGRDAQKRLALTVKETLPLTGALVLRQLQTCYK